jgi:hypothetical protein
MFERYAFVAGGRGFNYEGDDGDSASADGEID